jgi:glycosyltransferase involved in cell wall biosynthesis
LELKQLLILKILLIHQYFLEPDDGGGSRFNEMTKIWADQGCEVTVIAGMMHANGKEKRYEYKGKLFVKKQQGKVEVWRCHVSEAYNKGFIGRLWGYFSFMFSSIWAGLFKAKQKYDVVLVTSPPLFVGITAYIVSRWKRIPLVFEIRDLWPESAIDTGVVTNKWIIKFAYRFESFIYKKAKLINVLTPAFKDTLINKKNVAEDKVVFIPNAADFTLSDQILDSDFDPIKFREQLSWDDKFVITYVGAHGVANHLSQVLDAAEIIANKDKNVLFVLIGGGMEKEMLMNSARKRNLDNVQFIAPVPKQDIFKYILASDFGMSVLKKADTFKTIYSNKTFDYMACKKPMFLLIDGVSRELVESADCGIYVEPENPELFVNKILDIKDDKSRINQMGLNGYEYAKKHFDRYKLAIKYLEKLIDVS